MLQPVWMSEGGELLVGLNAAVRWPPATDRGDAKIGFDVGGGPKLRFPTGFLAELDQVWQG